ncbi:hypothetical protein TrST_g4914 [Triparma strigata]|uniref:Uncharacterized protein n=1 Tax=Triparma strigata TaxID=1606541 RepID=A0A9W7BBK5_9STRA|nr:hypothetical protein TrST_g4914 [Triparma strigata]
MNLVHLVLVFVLSACASSANPNLSSTLPPVAASPVPPPQPPAPVLDTVVFYQRRRTRVGSVPFIIITPTAEHWAAVGESLSSIGFSVLVCQVESDAEDGIRIVQDEEAARLVKTVMETMRWKRAILVGSGASSKIALDAAKALSSPSSPPATPSVVGLILTGDLLSLAVREKNSKHSNSTSPARFNPKTLPGRTSLLMCALKDVECPYSIIVDEVAVPQPSKRRFPLNFLHKSSSALQKEQEEAEHAVATQAVLVGGGMAPHRRLPEQFSWVLSRFFEERLIPNPTPSRIKRLRQKIRARTSSNTHPDLETMSDADSDSDFEPFLEEHDEETKDHENRPPIPDALASLAPILKSPTSTPTSKRRRPTLFEPATYLVFGRVLANTILYTTALGVAIMQGKNIAGGAVELRNQVRDFPQNLKDAPKKIPSAIGRTLNKLGKETYKIIATPEAGEGGMKGGGGLGVGIGSAVNNFNKMLKHFRSNVESKKNVMIDKIEKEKQDFSPPWRKKIRKDNKKSHPTNPNDDEEDKNILEDYGQIFTA